jgi:hypothetical protein
MLGHTLCGLSSKKTDQGTQFTSPRWKELTDSVGIESVLSEVESHNSIGSGERSHGPLRRIYQKVRFDFQDLQADTAHRISVKAMNDTMNYDGLVPSLLVFGIMPRYPGIRTELPTQAERMRALDVARTEMETITCKLRLRGALTSSIPSASSQAYTLGENILVYRDKETPHWQGPYRILAINEKQIFINNNGKRVLHSISQVKP